MASNNASLPTPADILDKFYKAESIYMAAPPEKRDFAAGMGAVLSKDVVIHQSPDLPYSQSEYRGHDGFQKWGTEMASLFSKLVVADPKVYEREGADEVLVLSRLELTSRHTGKDIEFPLCQVVGVDREKGVLTSIRPFYWDVEGLKKAIEK